MGKKLVLKVDDAVIRFVETEYARGGANPYPGWDCFEVALRENEVTWIAGTLNTGELLVWETADGKMHGAEVTAELDRLVGERNLDRLRPTTIVLEELPISLPAKDALRDYDLVGWKERLKKQPQPELGATRSRRRSGD